MRRCFDEFDDGSSFITGERHCSDNSDDHCHYCVWQSSSHLMMIITIMPKMIIIIAMNDNDHHHADHHDDHDHHSEWWWWGCQEDWGRRRQDETSANSRKQLGVWNMVVYFSIKDIWQKKMTNNLQITYQIFVDKKNCLHYSYCSTLL